VTKVAKLVGVSLLTRVVVENYATEDEIIKKAKQNFRTQLENDIGDNIDIIENDEECPYNPEIDN
jgi:hypothetical protein